jgi:hypothetical protein
VQQGTSEASPPACNYYKLRDSIYITIVLEIDLALVHSNVKFLILAVGVHKPNFVPSLALLVYRFLWPQLLHTLNTECVDSIRYSLPKIIIVPAIHDQFVHLDQ